MIPLWVNIWFACVAIVVEILARAIESAPLIDDLDADESLQR